jgi:hypothetical protein
MHLMKLILRTTGMTATILSFAALCFGQSRTDLISQIQAKPLVDMSKPDDNQVVHVGHDVLPPPKTVNSDPEPPFVPPAPAKIRKKNPIKKAITALVGAPQASPATPVGVQVVMSDGSVQTYPLGVWLMFQNGQLRGVMPTQYVNQIATVQPDGTWKYTRPGRNVQVWRNGLLQRQGPDYTLDQAGATITPVKYPDGNGTPVGWNTDDYVTVAYLY